jgi:hypothetical protein
LTTSDFYIKFVRMDKLKTVSAHNSELIGHFHFIDHPCAPSLITIKRKGLELFVEKFKHDNQDIRLSDAQWTKLIDALALLL